MANPLSASEHLQAFDMIHQPKTNCNHCQKPAIAIMLTHNPIDPEPEDQEGHRFERLCTLHLIYELDDVDEGS